MTVPAQPKLYHITHLDNLPAILATGVVGALAFPLQQHVRLADGVGLGVDLLAVEQARGLQSDAAMIARGGPAASIGMSSIKQRRLDLPVQCHPGDHVGDYVPFYFCPRSIMLYLIYCANHPELAFRGGQGAILHLEADLREVVQWGEQQGRRWAYTLSNAGAYYTEFRDDLGQLDDVDWAAVAARDFRDAQVKEGKQAEFLLHEFFPWHLVRRIGVIDATVYGQVVRALQGAAHRPAVEVRREWYF